jgi:putative serine protease PepD
VSTENEGAAATPAAGPKPTPPAVPDRGLREESPGEATTMTGAERGAAGPADGAVASASEGAAEGRTRTPEVTDTQGPRMSKTESNQPDQPVQSARPGTPPPAAPPQPPAPAGFGDARQPDPWGAGYGPASGSASASGSAMGSGPGSGSASGAPGDDQGGAAGSGMPPYGGTPYGGDPYGGGPAGPGGPQQPWGAPPLPAGPPPRGGRLSGGLIAAIVVVGLVAGGIGGGIGFWASEQHDTAGTTTINSASGDPKTLNRSPKSVAGIAAKALPSVVTIETSGNGEKGTGTGFVYDKEGHILTNNHVVADAAKGGKLTATFSDGKKYAAQIVGRAQGYDVAVIKLKNADGRKLNPLSLGKSNQVQVGDATIAIGAPFGLSGTVTTGIISAKNRPVASSDGQGSNASYMNALQTDASINPGNSGGPLLNAQGAVIGINSAIQPGSGGGGGGGLGGESQSGSVGLGFAIPVNQAKRVATQLISTGTPVYPVIGATVTMDEKGNGAAISQTGASGQGDPITKGGPADKAGLKPGDVITEFDGTSIDSGPTLIGTIWTHKPGDKVKLTYKRDGKESTTTVTLGSRKGDEQ